MKKIIFACALIAISALFQRCEDVEQYFWKTDFILETAYSPSGQIFNNEFLAQGQIVDSLEYSDLGFYYSDQPLDESNKGTFISATTFEKGKFYAWITGLQPGTSYYIRATGRTDSKVYDGRVVKITTTTDNITYVTVVNAGENCTVIDARTAIVKGMVTDLGNDNSNGVVEYGAYYWPTSNSKDVLKISVLTQSKNEIPVNAVFTVSLSDLIPGTSYSYKLFARNRRREAFVADEAEQVKSFTTASITLPLVLTSSKLQHIGASNAIPIGQISDNGNDPNIIYGFYYGTNEPLSEKVISDNLGLSQTLEDNMFTAAITNLAATTSYKVQAFAENASGEVRGNIVSFTTIEETAPLVANDFSTIGLRTKNITSTSVTIHGLITSSGGLDISECGALYGTSPDNLNQKAIGTLNAAADSFSVAVTGLSAATVVYYKIYATNARGTTTSKTVESIATKYTEYAWVNQKSDQGADMPNTFIIKSTTATLDYYELPPIDVVEDDGNTYRYYFLDRNLGASKSPDNITTTKEMAAIGYTYQFGWAKPSSEPSTGFVAQTTYGWKNDATIIRYTTQTSSLYGKYQQWPVESDPCPAGYHIPTSAEWQNLINALPESERNLAGLFKAILMGPTLTRNNAGLGQNEKFGVLLAADSQFSVSDPENGSSPRGVIEAKDGGAISFGGLNPLNGVYGTLPTNVGYVNVTQAGGAPIRPMRKMLVSDK